MARRRPLARVVALLVTMTVAVATPTVASAETADVAIEMTLLGGFKPASVAIETGATITWVNGELINISVLGGTGNHQVEADDGSFKSDVVAPKARFSHTFLLPATVAYHCAIHSTMKGTIEVTGEPVLPEAVPKTVEIIERSTDTTTWGFAPKDLVIDAGTKVTWQNNGSQTHTVTADDESFDSGGLAPGARWARTFDTPTSLRYRCTPHPFMEGTVRVGSAEVAPPPPPPPPAAAPPPRPATTVRQQRSTGGEPTTLQIRMIEPDPQQATQWQFDPASLGARVGDTAVWTNAGSQQHTVTAEDGSFDSGFLAPGGTFTRVLDRPGAIKYACRPHPWMKGVIVVAAASAARAPVPPPIDTEVLGENLQRPGFKSPSVLPPPAVLPVVPAGTPESRARLGLIAVALALLAALGVAYPTALDLESNGIVGVLRRPRAAVRPAVGWKKRVRWMIRPRSRV